MLQCVHYRRQQVAQSPSWATGRKEWTEVMKRIQHTLEYIAATSVITTSSMPLRAAAIRETREQQRRTVMATSLWWRSAAVAMAAHAQDMAVMPKKKQMVSPQEAFKHVHRAVEAVWQGTVEEEYMKQQLGQPNIAEQKLRDFKQYCKIAQRNIGDAQAFLSKNSTRRRRQT